jgi:hypothetical protein
VKAAFSGCLEIVNQKKRKPGRPKLPKGEARNGTPPAVRFVASDIKAVEAAAKAKNKSILGWVRSTLLSAAGMLKWAN